MRHRPRRRFGQHFLTDEGVLDEMVAALGLRASDRVLEIGPGHGALTARLAPRVARLLALEIDRDLVAALGRRLPEVEVIEGDALTADYAALFGGCERWRLLGNLPYNISTPLLVRLFGILPFVGDMHFLLQREVVARLAGVPGTKAWGRLSVVAQYHCQVDPLFDVAPESFSPPPKVESSFVRLTPRPAPPRVADEALLGAVLRSAFSARRKRLGNALKTFAVQWGEIDVSPEQRPDQLGVAGYVAIANHLARRA